MTGSTPTTDSRFSLEGELWSPHPLWNDLLTHLLTRLGRAYPLTDALNARIATNSDLDIAGDVALLDEWSDAWSGEAVRFLDEHLPLYVRPDATVTRRVRDAASHGAVTVSTALPAPLAEAILRHVGVLRSVSAVVAPQ